MLYFSTALSHYTIICQLLKFANIILIRIILIITLSPLLSSPLLSSCILYLLPLLFYLLLYLPPLLSSSLISSPSPLLFSYIFPLSSSLISSPSPLLSTSIFYLLYGQVLQLDDDLLASALEDLCIQRPRGDPTDAIWNHIRFLHESSYNIII